MSATVPTSSIRQNEDLVPHILKLNKDLLKKEKSKGPPKVTNPGVLMTVGQQAMQKLVDEARKKMGLADGQALPSYRVRVTDKARWAVPNLLNNVTEVQFYNMVTNQAWGLNRDINRPQPNGDWQPVEFRFLEVLDFHQNIPYLHMVVRWMDLNNETEIKYANGAPLPATNVTVQTDSGISDRIAKALEDRGTNNDQLTALLTQLLSDRHAGPAKAEPVAAEPTAKKAGKKASSSKAAVPKGL